jgi:3'-5' exoribonuclease 1
MSEDKIEVVAYNPLWPGMFLDARDAIRHELGQEAAVIEHIGSTSIIGARAKPTLDIMIGVNRLDVDARVIAGLEKLGYTHFGEFGIPGRHFFRKGKPPTHHVHWVVQDGDFWERQMLFRDYMRRHPKEMAEYEALKGDLAEKYHADRKKYTAAKTEFIESILQRARAWRDGPPDFYIIADLEATCWEDDKRPERMETIEIGAVKVQAAGFKPLDEFCEFIRPVADTQLSAFCSGLTSISQTEIDKALDFKTVFPKFLDWIGPGRMRFCSWGAYDLRQFRIDCDRHRMPFPADLDRHINLRRLFAEQRGIKPVTMKEALKMANIPLEGTHHRGIDDARNIVKLAKELLGDGGGNND